MANYSIKDLENFTGIKAHTIRIWEKRYNLVEPKRTCTNIRYYDDEDLKKLLNVSILNKNGIKISNIVNLSDEAINEKVLSMASTHSDTESQVENLVVAMIELDENKFEKIFNTAVINMGFEEAVIRILYPFFVKIGVLWQIGSINPAQEHFISNLVRQKLIVAIDGLVEPYRVNTRSFLLYLPEGEHHELGLLFYYYILKKNGHKVIYLGENVPFNGLLEVAKVKKVDAILTAFVAAITEEEFKEYLQKLSENFEKTPIYLNGLQASLFDVKFPENITLIHDVAEFKKLLLKNYS
jgi:DNA-binding transcriptional MerR regulator